MRKILVMHIVIFSFPFSNYAQTIGDSINSKPLLFESFPNGAVLMKSGAVEKAPLNYNTDDQSIVFIQNDHYLTLTGLELVDTVYIQQKKFVPVNNRFYQVPVNYPSANLLVQYSNKIHPLTATTDHSGTSKQANSQVSNTVSDIYVNKTYRGNYSVEIIRHFWILKEGKMHKASSIKQILKAFPANKSLIETYVREHSTNINIESDMIDLVGFCNTL